MVQHKSCVLCTSSGGELIVQAKKWRVIRALDQQDFPLTYRVIWNAHVAEFSELPSQDRHECMDVVVWVEQAMRDFLAPDKINLAALGNVVPHLHWHIIARYTWDCCFPAPVWANASRRVEPRAWTALEAKREQMESFLRGNAGALP